MISKLEQKVLVYGFTITQLIMLAGIAFVFLMLFQVLIGMFGLFGSIMLGVFVVGIPAVILRLFHVFPENFFENIFYFYLKKPDVYLPGRECKNGE